MAQRETHYVRIQGGKEVQHWLYPSRDEANETAKQLRKNPDFKKDSITVVDKKEAS